MGLSLGLSGTPHPSYPRRGPGASQKRVRIELIWVDTFVGAVIAGSGR